MFNPFKKKPSVTPPDLLFKSNEAAFQYACAYLNTSLKDENPVLAIVLSDNGSNNYCVKISNNSDPSIPAENPEQLLEDGNTANICFGAAATDRAKNLKRGDLVAYVAVVQLAAMGKGNMGGVLIAKLRPEYSMVHGGWRGA